MDAQADQNSHIKTAVIDEMTGRIDNLEAELKAIKQWAMLAVAIGALNLATRWLTTLTE